MRAAQDTGQPGARHQRKGRSAADGGGCSDRSCVRLRRDRNDDAGCPQCRRENAVACAVGASVGRWGTLFQCSSRGSRRAPGSGMAGFTSYAETVSVYGTEKSFVDGDDTPVEGLPRRGLCLRAGSRCAARREPAPSCLMGFHDKKSMLYLEARCLCLQRAMGVQGTQNGGIDGAPVTCTVPGRHARADGRKPDRSFGSISNARPATTRATKSEIRVGAKILPYLVARIGSHLLGLRLDPEIRQLIQRLAAQRRGASRTTSCCSAISRRTAGSKPVEERRARAQGCMPSRP